MRGYAAVIAVVLALAAIFGGIIYAGGQPLRNDLRLCDEAIMATLKAPATYRRIEAPTFRRTSYRIVYDAENSFGVPLRSTGYCSIHENGGRADWIELPEAQS